MFAEARPPPLNPAGPASPGGFPEHRVGVGKRSLKADRERLRPEPRHTARGARGHHPPLARPPARAHRLGSARLPERPPQEARGGAGKSGGPSELPFLPAVAGKENEGTAAAWGRPGRSLEEWAWGPAHSRSAPAVQQPLPRSLAPD